MRSGKAPGAGAAQGRSFTTSLAFIVAGAAAIRVAYAITLAPATGGLSDGFWFREVSKHLVEGHWFALRQGHSLVPTADHPPLYPLWLAFLRLLGIQGDTALRTSGALLGAGTTCLIGLLGRRLGGDRLGLVAAGLDAIHPLLIAADGALLSETLYVLLLTAAMLAAKWLYDNPTRLLAAIVGGVIALAALTRPEALLLVPLLLGPVIWRTGPPRRLALAGTSLICMTLLLAPFALRNLSVFGRLTISSNYGKVIGGANDPRSYHGASIGALDFCIPTDASSEGDVARRCFDHGVAFARAHVSRVPVVVLVRVLREWSAFQPFAARSLREQGRRPWVQGVGVGFDYALFVLAAFGVVALRRVPAALLVVLSPLAMVTLVAAATYGSVRLRAGAEPALVLLAAAGLLALLERVRASAGGTRLRTARPPDSAPFRHRMV